MNISDDSSDLSNEHPHSSHAKKQPSLFGRLLGSSQKSSPPILRLITPEELPPLSRLTLTGYTSATKHRLLDAELAGNIRNLLPPRLQLFDQWDMVYSLEQHGISLNSLYRNCNPENQLEALRHTKAEKGFADNIVSGMVTFGVDTHLKPARPHGYVMVIEDEKHNKFGCYLNEHLRATDHKRYYGNGECFLWKCEWYDAGKLHGARDDGKPHRMRRFKAYMYTGLNDNIVYSNHDFIAVGSSQGQNGLWIDKSLYSGVSYPCDTFGNEILNLHEHGAKFGKFKVMSLEVWRVGALV